MAGASLLAILQLTTVQFVHWPKLALDSHLFQFNYGFKESTSVTELQLMPFFYQYYC